MATQDELLTIEQPANTEQPTEDTADADAALLAAADAIADADETRDEPDPNVFVFVPTVGDDLSPIEMRLDFDKPDFDKPEDRIWLYDLGSLQMPESMWVWLRRAQVPRPVAHRVVALPIEEQARCIEEWLKAAQGVGAGES